MSEDNAQTALDVQRLWEKQEDIAMHFNDLLIQLRTRSLAGIAAVATLIGVFAENIGGNPSVGWLLASGLFATMAIIWIAIFYLDAFYYNKLLIGAVTSPVQIEEAMESGEKITSINMSRLIEQKFTEPPNSDAPADTPKGVRRFYGIVLALIMVAGVLSAIASFASREPEHPASPPPLGPTYPRP